MADEKWVQPGPEAIRAAFESADQTIFGAGVGNHEALGIILRRVVDALQAQGFRPETFAYSVCGNWVLPQMFGLLRDPAYYEVLAERLLPAVPGQSC